MLGEKMFQLYKPSLENKKILDSFLQYNRYRNCELSSANNVLWADYYDTSFTIVEGNLVYCHLKEGKINMVTFPVGQADLKVSFDYIWEYFKDNNIDFCMYLVNEEMFSLIDSWYPGVFKIEYDRDDADYLYSRESLATLSGKKLHGKRNHINRFLENYPDYIYERIDDSNLDECLAFAKEWANDKESENAEGVEYEKNAIEYALNNMKELELEGALIRIDGELVAFTVGEELTADTYVIHFEKARADIQGAYSIINRDFVRNELSKYEYVNREEDLGLEGLRKAKLSYKPIELINKGIVSIK